jgi:hypothetical protein
MKRRSRPTSAASVLGSAAGEISVPVCGLTAPGQPCAKWTTPPRGECSRQGGSRVCAECIKDLDAPALGFRRTVLK